MRYKIVIFTFFLFIGILYLHNVTRDIYSGDIGDLVTASCVRGVAHPPGYPLFMVLGGALCQLPVSLPPVTKVALLSVFASLTGLIFFYIFAKIITKNTFIGLLATSILAFSHQYWLHAEIPEVFGLNNCIALAALLLAVAYYRTRRTRYLYVLAAALGVSLTHHHTILFLYPTIGLLVAPGLMPVFKRPARILKLILLFLLGLSIYLYVPIAASAQPVINWDNAVNWSNFTHLILRKDYGAFAPSIANEIPLGVKFTLLRNYFWSLAHTFSYQVVLLAMLGFVYYIRKARWLGFTLLLGYLLTGPFFVFYASRPFVTTSSIGIIERFYGLSFIVFMMFVPAGLLQIKSWIERFLRNKSYSYIILAYFIIVPVALVQSNYPRTDLSRVNIGNRLADDMLGSLPQGAVLFVSTDTPIFNVWYHHYVLGKRPDIGLVNPPSVGGNKFLDDAVNEYYEKNPDTDFDDLIFATIGDLRKSRRIYANHEQLVPGTIALPLGLVYELIDEKDIPEEEVYIDRVESHLRTLQRPRRETLTPAMQNLVAGEIPTIYSNAFVRIGNFVDAHYGNPARAEGYYRRALWMDPDNPAAYAGLGLVQYKAYDDCDESLANIKTAIEIYPLLKTYYLQYALIATRCGKDKSLTAPLIPTYDTLFRRNLLEDVAHYEKGE